MLIPFPVASLIGALVTEIVFWATNNMFWADVPFWLLLAGVVTGAVAASSFSYIRPAAEVAP
jgi:uncharacterized membrane protein